MVATNDDLLKELKAIKKLIKGTYGDSLQADDVLNKTD